ncbi:MAG TPA: two-component regulator propeller domain-containing protein, partial [Bryobacteraceae bacterium]|nr:two-component regulator propeller domain-containing protein [Bryobacteraceae bacterium]
MRFLPLRCALLAGLAIVLLPGPGRLFALDPHKELTQYTHTVWTRAQGLPQDTIRALAQTSDGYLWVGTNEGLARFDGYDFVTFTKGKGALPSQRIRKLWAGRDGNLWIGTMRGLVLYSGGVFKTFTAKDGLPPGKIDALIEDHSGTVWVISGENLYYLDKGKFVTYPKQRLALVGHPQVLYEDAGHQLWVASAESVLKRTEDGFAVVLGAGQLRGNTVTSLLKDSMGLWVGSTQGLLLLKDGGSMSHFTMRDGLPNNFVQTLHKDRAGNLWVGTYGGLSRFEGGRFTSPGPDQRQDLGWILCMYEDHEGDLWLGMNSALIRLSDSRFSMYGLPEGLPSDESNVVHRDSRDELWVGYHSSGLVALKSRKRFTIRDGLPSNEIFGIRGARNGDLLISTRNGLSRMHQGRFTNYSVPDPLGRSGVYSALEDIYGRLWAANASGVYEFEQGAWRAVVLDRSNTNNVTVTLAEGPDGTIWAGSLGSGLVEIQNTASGTGKIRRFTESDGLGTDEIRSLYAERDGTLWIGTLDGGMIEFRNGVFHRYTAGDGLLSDNVSHVQDDGRGSLWLSTTRGISRISKQQLRDFSAGKIRALQPENFGTADGLRSAQCGPGAPAGSGSAQTSDGRLWFPTSAGVASIDPQSTGRQNLQSAPPAVHITGIFADGRTLDLEQAAKLEPDTGNIEFHYTGIHLSAP